MGRAAAIISVALLAIAGTTLGRSAVYDTNIVPEHCQKAPPVRDDYTPTGISYKLGDMDIYETLTTNTTDTSRVLIDVYDIFGYTDNAKQVADVLALDGNFRVVMPDYFRGPKWTAANFPPKDPKEITTFLETRGDWEDTVKADTINVINYYKEKDNVSKFGIFGFCWGGKISTQAATDLPDIKVAALVHPSSVTTDEAYGVKAPMFLLPSQNEPDMVPFFSILVERLGVENAGHFRFENMPHGFAGARGNFSDPTNVAAVDRVITTIKNFFTDKLQ